MTALVAPIQEEKISCKPFVKWAGGKTQLLPEILKRIPEEFGTYHEPFLGGGAVFFALQPKQAVLSDLNEELVSCYSVVRDNVEELVSWLKQYSYDQEEFYRIRALDRSPEYALLPNYVKAARLIYLNKTCFNGLYRVNRSGHFNTPFGRYNNPTIVDEANLTKCSQALQGAVLELNSFESVVERAQTGDFVYFDPPYPPLSSSADFTSYTDKSFSWDDQVKLRDVCLALDKKGVRFLLSNAGIDSVRELYEGFQVSEVVAKRAINSRADRRGEVFEFLISNSF